MNTNHYSVYAQERIDTYSEQFSSFTITQLVNAFNRETSVKGWVSERAYYLEALVAALEARNISMNCIKEQDVNGKTTISLKHHIGYSPSDNSLKIIE